MNKFDNPALLAKAASFRNVHGQHGIDAENRLVDKAMATTGSKKLFWLQRASEVVLTSVAKANVSPCKSGCSHCCHIAVAISDSEAKALAKASGRAMATLPERSLLLDIEKLNTEDANNWQDMKEDSIERYYGQACPFLKDNLCSQYASRPLACRHQISLAQDDEPCKIGKPNEMIPFLDMTQRKARSVVALGLGRRYADIRDWFPLATKSENGASQATHFPRKSE